MKTESPRPAHAELPTDIEALHDLCKDLAPDALAIERTLWPSRVRVEGPGGELSLRCWNRVVSYRFDAHGDPNPYAEGGEGLSLNQLAHLIGMVLGIEDVLSAAPDPIAYLRRRAEMGVGRG